jgi:hypothetical protein
LCRSGHILCKGEFALRLKLRTNSCFVVSQWRTKLPLWWNVCTKATDLGKGKLFRKFSIKWGVTSKLNRNCSLLQNSAFCCKLMNSPEEMSWCRVEWKKFRNFFWWLTKFVACQQPWMHFVCNGGSFIETMTEE